VAGHDSCPGCRTWSRHSGVRGSDREACHCFEMSILDTAALILNEQFRHLVVGSSETTRGVVSLRAVVAVLLLAAHVTNQSAGADTNIRVRTPGLADTSIRVALTVLGWHRRPHFPAPGPRDSRSLVEQRAAPKPRARRLRLAFSHLAVSRRRRLHQGAKSSPALILATPAEASLTRCVSVASMYGAYKVEYLCRSAGSSIS
jgi:hypothetical protein